MHVEGTGQQLCTKATAVQLRMPHELADPPSSQEAHLHPGKNRAKSVECGGVEGVECQPAVCPGRGGGRKGGNRHARVVDGRVFFQTASLNGDTCPVNPALQTCKLVVRISRVFLFVDQWTVCVSFGVLDVMSGYVRDTCTCCHSGASYITCKLWYFEYIAYFVSCLKSLRRGLETVGEVSSERAK